MVKFDLNDNVYKYDILCTNSVVLKKAVILFQSAWNKRINATNMYILSLAV